MMCDQSNRREFLKSSAGSVAVTAAVSAMGGVHALASRREDKLRLGLIGCGGIMNHHVKGLVADQEDVLVEWLCDVDPRQIDKIAQHVTNADHEARRTSRYEDVLDDPRVDAVIVATPHHWHAPIAIAAMEAGKDVYIEKPISHVYDEGALVIDAARRHERIVQQGSQMRNCPVTLEAERLLNDGLIGDVKVARAWTAEMRRVVHPVSDTDTPEGVDYDRWLGPAPVRPFNPIRFHGSWRLFRDYGNGEIGDDGIHDIDMACWGLGVDAPPVQVTARGGRMMLHGHVSEYPDNMNVTYEFADGRILMYENYPFTEYGLHGFDNGNVFYGTEGYMVFSRRGAFSVFLGPKAERGPTESREIRGQRGYREHMTEFLTSIRTREPTRARPEVANMGCTLVHFGDIAQQTRGQLNFNAETQQFVDCEEANAMLSKDYRKPYELEM